LARSGIRARGTRESGGDVAEKRCGKSTVLALIGKLARRPLHASNITTRRPRSGAIETWRPTLIDEADSLLGDNEKLRGVLNSGHTRTGVYSYWTITSERRCGHAVVQRVLSA
jgi:hypothetical protein